MSNHVALLGPSIATNPSFLALAHTSSTYPCYPTCQEQSVLEFHPTVKSDAEALGGLLRDLFERSPLVRGARNVASYFWSKLPTLTIPGASASPAGVYTSPASACVPPIGSFKERCNDPKVTFDPIDNQCIVTTSCETMFEGLPHKKTSYRYPPTTARLTLYNNNGTLESQNSRAESINIQLRALPSSVSSSESLAREEAIIATLESGDIITLNDNLQPAVVISDDWVQQHPEFSILQKIAEETGGIMGYSQSDAHLNPLLTKMFAHFLHPVKPRKSIDIAFILDTTYSMNPKIKEVKNNLVLFLKNLQAMHHTNRIALLEYRDWETYQGWETDTCYRVKSDFTSDLDLLQTKVMELVTEGGGTPPEALLDVLVDLDKTKNNIGLSWRPEAQSIMIIITDAPSHPTTRDGLDANAVIAKFQTAGSKIAIYPVVGNPDTSSSTSTSSHGALF